MKKTKIIYWISTILFAGMMLFSGIGTFADPAAAKAFMTDFLGYPEYFTTFLNIAKILGAVAILIPMNFPRVKEWAYAGLFFDLAGAIFSVMSKQPDIMGAMFMIVLIVIGAVSYITYHQLQKHRTAAQA